MILHPSFVLAVMPGETPVGYASRVALRIGCSLRTFCNRIDVPLQALLDGATDAVVLLCRSCQLPNDTFADTTFVTSPGRRLLLAGQMFSVDQISRHTLRICPSCIEQQLGNGGGIHAAWSPREWHILPLHVCDQHSEPMLSVFQDGPSRHRQDFASAIEEAVFKGSLGREETETVPESGLGHHVRWRLRGIEDDHWLSRQPLYAAIKTAEMIGTAAVHGVSQQWMDLGLLDRFEAGRVGYDILSDGDAGLRRLFADFQRDQNAETNSSGLLSTFGRIYVSMSQWDDVAYDPLRDVLRQHIIETMPFGPGDVVLGKEVKERRIHSVRTVAPELGLAGVTAHKRLRFIGVIDEADAASFRSQITFDAQEHADDIRRLASALQRAEAGRYLGLRRVYEDVAPILDMVGSMNIDKTNLIDQVYAKEDLDAFLASILSKASLGPTAGFEPIAKASRRVRTGIANVLDMILKGEITDIRLSPAHKGIMSVMVRKQDIFPALVARRPWITLTAAAKATNIRDVALTALVRNNIIPSKGVSPVMLQPDDLDVFTRNYMTRWDVAREYRSLRGPKNRFSITKAIAIAGLEPAFDERKSFFKFYRRDEVLAAFGPPPD